MIINYFLRVTLENHIIHSRKALRRTFKAEGFFKWLFFNDNFFPADVLLQMQNNIKTIWGKFNIEETYPNLLSSNWLL